MSVESNITKDDNWFRDEDKIIEFTVFQPDGVTKENITGYAMEFILCNLDESVVFTKTTGAAQITITDGPNGLLEVEIDEADTAALVAGKFKYEIQRTDVGLVSKLAHGTALIQQACS